MPLARHYSIYLYIHCHLIIEHYDLNITIPVFIDKETQAKRFNHSSLHM